MAATPSVELLHCVLAAMLMAVKFTVATDLATSYLEHYSTTVLSVEYNLLSTARVLMAVSLVVTLASSFRLHDTLMAELAGSLELASMAEKESHYDDDDIISEEEDTDEAIVGGEYVYDDETQTIADNDTADEDSDEDLENEEPGITAGIHASGADCDPVAANYIHNLASSSGLYLPEHKKIEKAYTTNGELGLFSLFITKEFRRRIQRWTNEGLSLRGHQVTSENEFDAYIGLELAMSICSLNDIAEFWSEKTFIDQRDFSDTMSRNRFQAIRARVKFHPLDATAGYGADPLWHSRVLMEHMQTKFAELAIPFGTSSLDENSVRTKARTRAKSFIPSKPDKYGIQFYAVVACSLRQGFS
ncbi:hypothetical protein JG688_00017319 [Phytophthora aleatoria]|uniref:PiggyBac transposable element-derived protein domain-containing protein n=1 Tax=Phytophthora aleatoria TaxID=2496075 RepID=A0A8J5IE24_9STRA|nr:hypothetical protein JG688_00017319 [Phytophthora aleatoria]